MFLTLLLVAFGLSVAVSFGAVQLFKKPIGEMFYRIIKDPISVVWQKYVTFATYVVGISGGVGIYQLERYISARKKDTEILELTTERWTIEVYRVIIETLQSIAWMYLLIFICALITYVIVRGFELKNTNKPNQSTTDAPAD